MMKRAAIEIGVYVAVMSAVILLVAGCSPRVVWRDRIVTVNVPVAQPCAGTRPAPVPTLRERYADPAWAAMDVRQKAAAVGKQAVELRGHGEQLNAATAACPEIQ